MFHAPVQVQCERLYIKPFNPFILVLILVFVLVLETASVNKPLMYLYSEQETKRSSDTQWLKTVLTSGTLVDRVAALTVTVQNSPIHNMAALDSLVSMATKKGRREAMMAVGQ